MNVIKIDKHVPLPKPATYQGGRQGSKYNFLKTLEVGDSFEISGNTAGMSPKSAMCACYTLAKNYRKSSSFKLKNFRVSVRTTSGTSADPKAIRIWRVQ
jgi:hypothetical protein